MKEFGKRILISLGLSLIPTILIWIPFFLRIPNFWHVSLPQNGMVTIVSNYDGPLFLVAAKTLYNKNEIKLNYQFPLSTEYYTAHFPLFPVLIRFLGMVANYPYAMLMVTLLSSVIAIYYFNLLAEGYLNKKDALFLTFIFSIFPARWLIVRSVGSAEPLFIAAIIASIFYFKEKKYLWAGIWGLIAQLTKSPGILLFISYLAILIFPSFKNISSFNIKRLFDNLNVKKTYPILLIPFGILIVFSFYGIVQGDFWAYFHSGDNIHLFFPPFQIFDYSAPWVGTYWLEEVIFVYLLGAIGVLKLFSKNEYQLGIFSGIFFIFILFVSHRDIIRYILPIVPFLLIGFSDYLVKREFKIAFSIIIIPIYLFSLAYISQNVMPISNWAPFL